MHALTLDHLTKQAEAVVDATAVRVIAMVATGLQQLVEQISVGRVDLDPIDAAGLLLSDGDAIDLPRISAEPVTTEGYVEGLVSFSHDPRDDSEAEELEETAEAWELGFECEDSADFDYDDGSYTGLAQLWTDCFDKGLGHLVISTLVGEDHLLVQVFLATDADIDADIGAATRIIETFSFTGE